VTRLRDLPSQALIRIVSSTLSDVANTALLDTHYMPDVWWLCTPPKSTMAPLQFDVLTTTAAELQSYLCSGKLTSARLVEVFLSEIEKYNGYLRAVIATAPKSTVMKIATALDEERSNGTTRSPLHGLPILVKVLLTSAACYTEI